MGKAYLGSKATAGLCQAIIGMMPRHNLYLETHLGGGAIMKRKPAALHSIGIDLDAQAIADFSCDYPVELIHGCCHEYLRGHSLDCDALVYVDPPYLKSTRKAPERYRYRYDYEEQDHVELLERLISLPCQVMVSGYRSSLYDELLADWRRLEVQVMNQAGVVTEVIWYNFEIDKLHWSRWAGKNFTDRQRIKRKAERWARRYGEMGHGERLAVLGAIMAVAGEHADVNP